MAQQSPEPALAAIRALLDAASAPMAVFDETGNCLAASRTHASAGRAAELTPFSPDGVRQWSLVTQPILAAETGGRAKARFLGAMSHELRTPLNAVIGFAELMHEEALGPLGHPDYREYAGLILRSGVNLLDMISNLLDFSRAESGSLELSVAPVELVRLLRAVIARARERMEQAGAPGRVELGAELPPGMLAVRGDEQRLRQVLLAVLDNAVKFTPDGGQVTVAARALDGNGAEIVVNDSGIGMSAGELRQVFEPFWQADTSLARARHGAGMGLKLARHLVALHGGTVAMHSEPGQGTRVVLRLPAAPPGDGAPR